MNLRYCLKSIPALSLTMFSLLTPAAYAGHWQFSATGSTYTQTAHKEGVAQTTPTWSPPTSPSDNSLTLSFPNGSVADASTTVTPSCDLNESASVSITATWVTDTSSDNTVPQTVWFKENATASWSGGGSKYAAYSGDNAANGLGDPYVVAGRSGLSAGGSSITSTAATTPPDGWHMYTVSGNTVTLPVHNMTAAASGSGRPSGVNGGVAVTTTLSYSIESVDMFGVYLNGNWVEGTTQTIYAGQQINLAEHYQLQNIPSVPGTTVTYSWELDGHPIKSYVIGSDNAEETDLTSADLSQAAFTCYFTGSGPATVICRVTETAPNGDTWYGTGSCGLNIYKPQLSPVSTLGQFHYNNTGTQATLEIGDASGNPYGDGIHITSTGTIPPGMPAGSYGWLQLLHDFEIDINHVLVGLNTVDPTLDRAFPYNLPSISAFEDSPDVSAGTIAGLDPELDITINATAYLMWNCGLSGAIWVPDYYIDWNASGTESGGQITSSTGPTITNTDTDPVNPPTWDNTRT